MFTNVPDGQPARPGNTSAVADPFGWLAAGFGLQQTLAEATMSWQRMWFSATQEAYDEWVCRFGGGVPIDG